MRARSSRASAKRYSSTCCGKGMPFPQQVELYRFALARLDRARITPALCKEDVSVWQAVGLRFAGCHCTHAGSDVAEELVSTSRYEDLTNTAQRKRP